MKTQDSELQRATIPLWTLVFSTLAFLGSLSVPGDGAKLITPKVTEGCQVPPPMGVQPDRALVVDFTVTVVPITAAHPNFSQNSIGVGFAISTGGPAVQGMELFLVRGTTYTFSISGGHPFAFTTSSIGGPANIGQSYPATNGITGTPTGTGTVTFTPNASYPNLIYYNCNLHNAMGWKINISDPPLKLAVKAMLEGPYNSATLMMRDSLRSAGLLPNSEPYTGLSYAHVGSGGESAAAGLFTNTGADAPADWMMLELRSSADPASIVATRTVLVQRDGDVMAPNGSTPILLALPTASYFVALRHRNHLGVMTAAAVALSSTLSTIDFTLPATAAFGTNAEKNVSGTMVLWAGDVNFNGQIKYTGPLNDRDPILVAIGGTIPTTVVNGQYRQEDVNMNVQVKYSGSLNDRDIILVNIGGTVPTTVRSAQLP